MPLDFVYSLEKEGYDFFGANGEELTNAELMAKINTGKGDPQMFSNKVDFIDLSGMLGEPRSAMTPLQITKANFEDDTVNPLPRHPIGYNEVTGATAVSYTYIIQHSQNP